MPPDSLEGRRLVSLPRDRLQEEQDREVQRDTNIQTSTEIRSAAKNLVENLARARTSSNSGRRRGYPHSAFQNPALEHQRYDESIVSLLRPVIDLSLTKNEKFSIFFNSSGQVHTPT